MSENDEIENKEKKNKKGFGVSFKNQVSGFAAGGIPLFFTMVLSFLVMGVVAVAIFFAAVQGEEKVMVPAVVGKSLTTALLEMQQKALYPELILRYSDVPGQQGIVLEQDPIAGSIVKAYRTIKITVSRGMQLDRMENYVGKQIDPVQEKLQLLFNDNSQLIKIASPVYQKDSSPLGTIIAQYPTEGTLLDEDIKIQLIVSSGNQDVMVQTPNIVGMSLQQVYSVMESNQVIFDFSMTENASIQEASVSSQDNTASQLPSFTRINATIAFPSQNVEGEYVYGIFSYKLTEYPYPVPLHLESIDNDGNTTEIVSFSHPGKDVYIPYKVKKGSVLSLYMMDSLITQQQVN